MEITAVILIILAMFILSGIKVVNQYQRGVVLTPVNMATRLHRYRKHPTQMTTTRPGF